MALSDTDRAAATVALIETMFVRANATATFDKDEIRAAINAIDDFFAASISTLNDAQTVEVALNQALPTPFRTDASLEQKALALAYWAMRRGGIV